VYVFSATPRACVAYDIIIPFFLAFFKPFIEKSLIFYNKNEKSPDAVRFCVMFVKKISSKMH